MITCDLCRKEFRNSFDISLDLDTYSAIGANQVCTGCADLANKIRLEVYSEHTKQAVIDWRERIKENFPNENLMGEDL